ncbi:MAG: AmmeMemoRadiSam system protein A [Terriglobia bacterium]
MFPLSESSQKELLSLARQSIREFLQTRRKTLRNSNNPELQSWAGVFVSLHRHGKLRGCIGVITASSPLLEVVQECAVSAATSDPRFEPLTLGELEESIIEISVLSPLEPIQDVGKINVGIHGLLVSQHGRRGLLLPQVATEQGWDGETFLAQTCRKAGLPMDAWHKGAEISIFTAAVFQEK